MASSVLESPTTYFDFHRMFPDETACLKYLEQLRWPDGFVCEGCSTAGEPFRFAGRPKVLKCRACHQDTSITAGTVMHRSKTSLHVWFWATYLIATQSSGVSALELQKKFGIERYETAFQLLHKLRDAMVRPGRDKIGSEWPLEMDLIFIGGRSKSGVQGKTKKTPAIIAVEVRRKETRSRKTGKVTKRPLAGRVRLQHLSVKSANLVDKFVRDCVAPGATIVTDDGSEFSNLSALGFNHRSIPMRGDREKMDKHLPMAGRVTANLKTWIDGTFHGVLPKHLQSYMNEYMFRFNRRFFRAVSFRSLLAIAILSAGLTYREVYEAHTAQPTVK
jgi:hypothetical protein